METQQNSIIYGHLSEIKKQEFPWGAKGTLWSDWDEFKLNGYLVDFTSDTPYTEWADKNSENLCLIEDGSAELIFNGKAYTVDKRFVFKVMPGQNPIIKPNGKFVVLSIQMPSSVEIAKQNQVNLAELQVVDTEKLVKKVYEFETLAQEVFTPPYRPALGLIKFAFVNPIPIHQHPQSARLIRPISGKGQALYLLIFIFIFSALLSITSGPGLIITQAPVIITETLVLFLVFTFLFRLTKIKTT